MKFTLRVWVPLVSLLVVAAMGTTAFADLNASAIKQEFNSMNNNTGFRFTHSYTVVTQPTLTSEASYANVNVGAYQANGGTSGGSTWFKTFCIEPGIAVSSPMVAKLNYENGMTRVQNTDGTYGTALTFGAAYLYAEYAKGNLGTGATVDSNLYTALQVLLGYTTLSNWSTNTYLGQLMTMSSGDKTVWTATYDPGKYDRLIGDYSVFVMNVTCTSGTTYYQDFLYLAKATRTDVPEPATILLWTLGGLGFAGSTLARKRRIKKLAMS